MILFQHNIFADKPQLIKLCKILYLPFYRLYIWKHPKMHTHTAIECKIQNNFDTIKHYTPIENLRCAKQVNVCSRQLAAPCAWLPR